MASDETNNGPDPTPEQDSGLDRGASTTRHLTISINYANIGSDGNNGNGNGTTERSFSPVVLRFANVPDNTSNERFSQIIALASEYIFQTLIRNTQRPRGISKEAFEKLELRDISSLDDKTCPICYEDLVNEPSVRDKRPRTEDEIKNGSNKRRCQEGSDDTGEGSVRRAEAVENEQAERQEEAQEDEEPTYAHSAAVLPCGHVFGRECLYKWTAEHNSCPICRAPILSEEEMRQMSEAENTNTGGESAQQTNFDNGTLESIRRLLYDNNSEQGNQEAGRQPTSQSPAAEGNTNETDGTNSTGTPAEERRSNLGPSTHGFVIFAPNLVFLPGNNNGETNTEANGESGTDPANQQSDATRNEASSSNDNETNNANAADQASGPRIRNIDDLPNGLHDIIRSVTEAIHRQPLPPTSRPLDGSSETQDVDNNPPNTNHSSAEPNSSARRFINLIPIFGSRNNGPQSTEQDSANINDPALENRYRAYIQHLESLRNGNTTTQDSSSSRFRLPSFFRLGRSIRQHQHSGGRSSEPTPSTPSEQPQPSNLFSSGVASYRNGNGVRTFNFTGEMPQPPNRSDDTQQEQTSNSNSEQPAEQNLNSNNLAN